MVDAITRAAEHLTPEQVAERWDGTIILITRRFSLEETIKGAFGLGWFIPAVLRYKRPLPSVLVASLFIQICGLITPVFFQIIIDKVLVHKGYSTLVLVLVGLVSIGFFHVILQYLRSYVLSHTASRIDVELGARLFDHMLRLPLAYFETRAAGQTVARVRELETVRSFLTGQGLTSALDLLFTVILIVVLFVYSQLLAIIVCLSIPCYLIVAAALRPILREKTKERFNRGAISNQFLVESMVGIQTIKSLAVEPSLRTQWEERLAGYVKTSFSTVVIASMGQNAIQYINKVTMALVLYFGALAVINNEMTVGALVAFNMIMGQVTAPILRLSQLWQDFQQVRISVDRLGDILNFPTESRSLAQAHLPPAKGEISVRNVTFRYHPQTPEVLHDVSISIQSGQVIGIVGPSGSGKSTFTKLLQRLYLPERGQIMIDGIDIAHVDPAWLRRQIGVVLQENMLFNRTVHDNIALANPGMPRQRRDGGGAARRRRRVRRPHAARLRHDHRGTRRQPVGRPAPAAGDRPRLGDQSAHPDLRRGHQRARLRKRAGDPGQHAAYLPRSHGDRHRAPVGGGAPVGPHHHHPGGADRRGRIARRAVGQAGQRVRPALAVCRQVRKLRHERKSGNPSGEAAGADAERVRSAERRPQAAHVRS